MAPYAKIIPLVRSALFEGEKQFLSAFTGGDLGATQGLRHPMTMGETCGRISGGGREISNELEGRILAAGAGLAIIN